MEYVLDGGAFFLQELASNYSGRKAARVKFWVAFANSFFISLFFLCVSRLVKR